MQYRLFIQRKLRIAFRPWRNLGMAVGLLVPPCLLGQSAVDPLVELKAVKASIPASNLASALAHTGAIQLFAAAELGKGPMPTTPKEPTQRVFYTVPPSDVARLLALADGVGGAIASGNPTSLHKSTVTLQQALLKEDLALRPTPAQQLAGLQNTTASAKLFAHYLQLPDLATLAATSSDIALASGYASELLALAGAHPEWPQGEAVFFGNLVAGEVAMQQGNVASASSFLLAAGKTSGSGRLATFGPSMKLAAQLLASGGTAGQVVVLDFLSECKLFWANDQGRLESWSQTIRDGRVPDFKPNVAF